MRITGANSIEVNQSQSLNQSQVKSIVTSDSTVKKDIKQQGSSIALQKLETVNQLDNSEETKQKVKEVVSKMNEMLDATNNTSKFMYHEGLDRYYVSVVDRKTEEVVKEIPPKKLLDAFYEMQKMLGMIVDEKI